MTHGRTLTALVAALAGCGPVFYDLIDGATGGLPGSSGQSGDPLTDPTGPGDTHGTEPPPTCGDGQHDGQESDLDCGGPCPPCGPGQMCHESHDCKEGPCIAGTCPVPECELPEDCTSGDPCRPGTCDLPTRRCVFIDLDGVGCEDGDLCSLGDTCVQGTCVAGEPRDCSDLDAPCAAGVCEPIKGQCVAMPAGDGSPCDDDGLACTPAGKCFQGACTDPFPLPPPLLFEDFDKPAPDWQLGDMWQIGPAQLSACAELGSDDPPDDHSPGPDGGLAGALIGGCLPEKPLPARSA